jgi:hypothetical protein
MGDQTEHGLSRPAGVPERPAPQQESRSRDSVRRAKLAVIRNTVFAAIVALGVVLIVLLAFNRPLVYRVFPWAEPSPAAAPDVAIEPTGPPAAEEGIYWVEAPNGPTMLVADPTLRPDLYVEIEFTYACG